MSKQIELPQMGESVETGTVLSVLVSRGDRVEEEQGLLEVETDKATIEIPSPEAGVVEEIHVEQGDEVKAGQVIVTLKPAGAKGGDAGERDGGGEKQDAKQVEKRRGAPSGKPREKAREDRRTQRSDPDRRPDGDEQERAEDAHRPREPEGPSASEESPRAEERDAPRDERAEERSREVDSRPDRRDDRGSAESAEPTPARTPRGATAAPTVRRLARELGVNLADVAASRGSGQVSEGDVKAHVRETLRRMSEAGLGHDPSLPDFEQWGEIERQPMSAVRRKTAQVVRHSWRQIPHVTQFDRADITDLGSFRERFAEEVEEAGGRLTLTAILIKIAARALSHFPRFNASVDTARAELVLKRYVHIGVAVDSEAGLLVPVIRDADAKDLTEVAVELSRLAHDARSGELGPDDLQGASFTVTNLGSLGAAEFTPIVPWPQVAILAVGRARPVPALDGGKLVERRILPVGVSYDHRCIDGGDAARFLRWIAETLEEPMRITMEPAR